MRFGCHPLATDTNNPSWNCADMLAVSNVGRFFIFVLQVRNILQGNFVSTSLN